jgi:cation:H+ antiporter
MLPSYLSITQGIRLVVSGLCGYTAYMSIQILLLIAGFTLLVWSADKFILGASATAKHTGLPPLLVGLTFVALGTSFPELMVSLVAAIKGTPELAVGNALGSNIVNIGLVIGLTAIICPIMVNSKFIRREFPIIFVIIALVGLMLWDGVLARTEGWLLFCGLFAYIVWLVYQGLTVDADEVLTQEYTKQIRESLIPLPKAIFWFIAGGVLLYISAQMVVSSGVFIARALGVDDVVIGLTIVAFGTSLPELMATLIAALKREFDIALGNVIGSNIFNLLGVLGLPALITPAYFKPEIFTRDYAIMLLLTLMLFIFAYGFNKKPGRINRWEGAALIVVYLIYMVILYVTR